MHNVFWSTCGVAIFVPFENVFCFLWSTGRLAYMPDAGEHGKQARARSDALRSAAGWTGKASLWRLASIVVYRATAAVTA